MLIENKPATTIGSASGLGVDSTDELQRRRIMTLSAFGIQGKRNHMEDFFDIGYQMKPCDQIRPNEWPYEYFYFGIFDGHGGREAANFAKQHLLTNITGQKDFWSQQDDDVMRAIRNGFAQTHSAMKKVMPTWPRSNRILPSTAGTTASIIFIKNGKFYTGHVGDSRIVISQEHPETKQWISNQLTDDHKPESKEETERIQRAGGEVRNKIGVHRVVWKRPLLKQSIECKLQFQKDPDFEENAKKVSSYPIAESFVDSYQTIPFLAIARSLGDFWSLNPYSGQYIVSPEPDVACRPIQPNDSCILLATDGLWNIMNSTYAVRILQELNVLKTTRKQNTDEYFAVNNFYDVAGTSENHAQSLVYIAYQIWERKRLRSDNITVVVAMLHDILGLFHRTNKPYATRASLNSSKVLSSMPREVPIHDPIQIEQTSSYMERVFLTKEPTFEVELPDISDKQWGYLQNCLSLPPELFMHDDRVCWNLIAPRNYERLSSAIFRKIPIRDKYGETWVYAKEVSDDPADHHKMPTKISKKSGKEVRDASAQATQNLHDYGIPWNSVDIEEDDEVEFVEEAGGFYINKKICLDENRALKDSLESKKEDVDEDELVDDGNEDDDSDEEKSAPKLRCLMNYSPPPRRTTRSSYQSMSENAKRKFHVSSSPTPKTKRRRSQPIRCAVK